MEKEALRAAQLLDHINALVSTIQYDTHKVVYANRKLREELPDFQLGDTCHVALFGRDDPCPNCPMERLKRGEEKTSAVMWVEKMGKWLQLEYSNCIEEGDVSVCACTGVDITEVKDSVNRTERVLDGIRAAAYTVGIEDHKLRSINQGLRDMLPDIQVGDLCYQALWGAEEPCEFCPILKLSPQIPTCNMERFNGKLGRYLSIDSVYVTGIEGPEIIFTGYDITRRVESEKRLENAAYRDVQIGIKNRLAFMEELSDRFDRHTMGRVCMMSLKNFNNFNVVYGRLAGDDLLEDLAAFFASFCEGEKLFRVGGAKMAVLADSEEDWERLQLLLKASLPESLLKRNGNFRLFIDAAVVEFPQFAGNPETLIHNAEYLLQRNKRAESSNVLYFKHGEQKLLERRNQISSIIRQKLRECKFQVYYQPIYEISTGRYSKCEALLRLYDETLGWISPAEFIPVAEEGGLVNDLGTFVLEKACHMVANRAKKGLPPVQINVNVSTVQFSRRSFFEDVVATLEAYRVDTKLIQLEVTESIIINSFDYIISIMKRLIDRGITFAVDDFGTGYSSLSYIGTLPVSCLKLDKSFIDKIVESEVYLMIVKNVIEIAKGLHFKIVAEGVETEKQLEILRHLGCDYIQGYYFSKALPEDEFETFLNKHSEPPQRNG